MTTESNHTLGNDPEFEAMRSVYAALRHLEPEAQNRVMDYVFQRLGLTRARSREEPAGAAFSPQQLAEEVRQNPATDTAVSRVEVDDVLLGVSPIAQKWMRRNDLSTAQLSALFSLGLDDIDLVARSVPGDNKKEKMRSVLLLKGAAAYLGSGAARVDDESFRETLRHYNAYDQNNFASYMKGWAPDASGSRESGYTLTARGLAAAADLIKGMSGEKKE